MYKLQTIFPMYISRVFCNSNAFLWFMISACGCRYFAMALQFVVFKVHCSKCLRKPQDQDCCYPGSSSPGIRSDPMPTHPQTPIPTHPSVVDQPWAKRFLFGGKTLNFLRIEIEWNEMLLKLNCLSFFFTSGFPSIFYSFTGWGRGCALSLPHSYSNAMKICLVFPATVWQK